MGFTVSNGSRWTAINKPQELELIQGLQSTRVEMTRNNIAL